MTTITIERSLLEQALGALTYQGTMGPTRRQRRAAAIAALRVALAAPATAPDELERLRKDAERYRWLRAQHWSNSDIAVVVSPKKHTRLGAVLPSLELLDETIDHMRKGTP